MIALANRLIETDDIATQWEAYYVAKGGHSGYAAFYTSDE